MYFDKYLFLNPKFLLFNLHYLLLILNYKFMNFLNILIESI